MLDVQPIILPNKEQLRALPPFPALNLQQITLVNSAATLRLAEAALANAGCIGFDTESKPTFIKGEVQTGPHLIQLATEQQAFLFSQAAFHLPLLKKILKSPDIIKVGFGVRNDHKLLHKQGLELANTVELSTRFKSFGIKENLGLQLAIAVLFQQYLRKSKHQTLSNWAKLELDDAQKIYAANDAYASLCVYHELLARQLI